MIDTPKRRQLQFIETGVTIAVDGKKLKKITIVVYARAKKLTNGPKMGPMCHGPQRRLSLMGSLRRRLSRRSEIGTMYEEKKEATLTERMALKAAVLPILMSARRREMTVLTRME